MTTSPSFLMTSTEQPKPTVASTPASSSHLAAATITTPPATPAVTGMFTSSRPSRRTTIRVALPLATRPLSFSITALI